jgi:type II secretory pathway component PulJ
VKSTTTFPYYANASGLKQQAGMSLLEVLIAFSLVSLLFVALFSSFNTVARSWESAEKRITKNEDRQLISAWIRNQLQQMMVLRLKSDEDEGEKKKNYTFIGQEKSIRFTAPLKALKEKGGIYFIEFFIEKNDKHTSLSMRYAPYRPDVTWEAAFANAQTVPIYQNFHHLEFSYLVTETSEDKSRWLKSWSSINSYPLLLKISAEAPESEPWADIVVELPQVDEYLSSQPKPSKVRSRSRRKRSESNES